MMSFFNLKTLNISRFQVKIQQFPYSSHLARQLSVEVISTPMHRLVVGPPVDAGGVLLQTLRAGGSGAHLEAQR